MRLATPLLLVALVLGLVSTEPAVAEDATPAAPSETPAGPILWLRGPFGTVPAGDAEPLDAFVRGAPLRLETGDPGSGIGEWRATFTPLDPTGSELVSSGVGDDGGASGGATVIAPEAPGTYRLDAEARLDPGAAATATWTIVVPDRPLPPDGL